MSKGDKMPRKKKEISKEEVNGKEQSHIVPLDQINDKSETQLQTDFGSQKVKDLIESIINGFELGVDFGFPYKNAKKKSLWKSGAEKVCIRFNLMPRYKLDENLMNVLKIDRAIAVKCELVDRITDKVVGEGSGIAMVGENGWPPNTCIQMAQKRSFVPAVRTTFALSDRFTDEYDASNDKSDNTTTPSKIQIQENGDIQEI